MFLQKAVIPETVSAQNQASSNKDSDTYTAVQEYLLENCKVDIPEDYLTARVNDYEKQYVQNYCDGDASTSSSVISFWIELTVNVNTTCFPARSALP